eukprot:4250631-Prymnesium_polylepis.1
MHARTHCSGARSAPVRACHPIDVQRFTSRPHIAAVYLSRTSCCTSCAPSSRVTPPPPVPSASTARAQ